MEDRERLCYRRLGDRGYVIVDWRTERGYVIVDGRIDRGYVIADWGI